MPLWMGGVKVQQFAGAIKFNRPSVTFQLVFQNSVTYVTTDRENWGMYTK